jgi:protein phosphatase
MGTTVTIALVDAPAGTVAMGHVGDSRAYRLREGELEQVTTDHSLVAELVESGVLTPEEAEHHPQRSAITKALGTEETVDADVFTLDAAPGDLFVLCSDGLSDMLSEEQIAEAIDSAGRNPRAAGAALVAAANAMGGEDNITVVLFELVSDDAEIDETVASGGAPFPGAAVAADDGGGQASGFSESEVTTEDARAEQSPRRFGAGAGGRLAAVLLIALVVAIGALLLYWGLTR